jgi:hypothetical protein
MLGYRHRSVRQNPGILRSSSPGQTSSDLFRGPILDFGLSTCVLVAGCETRSVRPRHKIRLTEGLSAKIPLLGTEKLTSRSKIPHAYNGE